MIGSGAHKNIRGTVMAACIIIIIIVMEFLSPQVTWPAVSPGLYVFAASWRGSSVVICTPGWHRYCVYCSGTFRWVSNPPPTPRASRESQPGYVMRRCPSSFRLPIHGVLWLPQWEVDSLWMCCTGTRLDWSGTSPSLLFKARSESSHKTGTRVRGPTGGLI